MPTDPSAPRLPTLEERRAKEHERRIRHQMRECVHFTGIQHDTCKAGVNYRAHVGGPDFGWARRIPCFSDSVDAPPCDKCQRTTREQAEAEIAASDAAFQRVNTALKAIRAKHGKAKGLADEMPCPNNCGGTLRYSISSYNGHVHGQCSTEGCAQWMQ